MRWVKTKPDHTISWTVQPHKKSINFGIFRHPGHASGPAGLASNVTLFPPPSLNLAVTEEEDDTKLENPQSAVIEKLRNIGLKQVAWIGKCEADKVTQGRYEVPTREGGHYALVFDNTFSKNISKTATFFLLSYPTTCQPQIQFGAQMHHSQAMASAMAIAGTQAPSKSRSPKLRALSMNKGSPDSLRKACVPAVPPPASESGISLDEPSSIHTGMLQKRRRKKHQGYAKRFFCLDYTTSTLSYYRDRNSSALRGAIPLSLAAIGANAKTREISIDSGAEIWHLRANNQAEFESWKAAYQKACQAMIDSTGSGDGLNLATDFDPSDSATTTEDAEWARLETLLGRISGTRDAVRRLCLETLSTPSVLSPSSGSGPSTPTEAGGDDYFRNDEKRSFWKRKTSATGAPSALFKRSVSSQLAVPSPGAESALRNGMPSPAEGTFRQQEYSMHGHCKAMLRDLNFVVTEFSSVIGENKSRRRAPTRSAVSRMSLKSIDSQEYFDAEEPSTLLDLHSDSEDEGSAKTEASGVDADSATSSDVEDDSSFVGGTRSARAGSLSTYLPPKSKSLQPLPMQHIKRRSTVAAPTIMPPSLIGFLRKNVGKDLSTIAMPVSANEPTSLLQRSAEAFEYSELLDQAAKLHDASERLLLVTTFAISSLSSSRVKERSLRKPFNPMLGETYELIQEDKGFRFVAEKVSHRPVQLAFHAEASDWSMTQSPKPMQKFWGKSSEINTEGKVRLVLYTTGEIYSWTAPTCFLRNIIAGEKYIEPTGTASVFNETSGQKAVITFKAKGMFSGRSEDVDVQLVDVHGSHLPIGLEGTWTQTLHRKDGAKKAVWSAGGLVSNAAKHYGMTLFASSLNEITEMEQHKLPPTDSRLRVDQRALENGKHDEAEHLKNELEEAQRSRRKDMEAAQEEWKPRWFIKVDSGEETVWRLKTGKEGYWDERSRAEWSGVTPVLKL